MFAVLCSILTVIFVIAKITGFLMWSWWLVFSPAIAMIVILLFVISGIGGLIAYARRGY